MDASDTPARQTDHPRLRFVTRAIVGVVVLGLSVLVFAVLFVTRPHVEVSDHGQQPVRVLVFEAQRVPVRRQWQGYGVVRPIDVADVPVRVTTTVTRVPDDVRPGRAVEHGELLMELDATDFLREAQIAEQRIAEVEAALRQWAIEKDRLAEQLSLDEADLAIAQSEFDRIKRITEQLAGNRAQLDAAERALLAARRNVMLSRELLDQMTPRRIAIESQLKAQRAQLALAQLNVERCRIVSPIPGVLAEVDADEGEQVRPGTRVARVVNLDKVEAPIRLPAASRQTVTLGDAAVVRATSDDAATCEATVRRISPVNDADTRTVTVYVEVDQHHLAPAFGTARGASLLLPGAFVSGVVTARAAEDRWVVPRRSVRGGRVQVVRDGQLVSRPVTVDYVIEGDQPAFDLPDTQWAVLAGDDALTTGDRVLIEGATALLDGQLVEPTLPSPSGRGVGGEGVSPLGDDGASDAQLRKPSLQPSFRASGSGAP